MPELLSEELREVRSWFRGYEHSGVEISGRGITTLLAKFNSLIALAEHQEEEASIQGWNRLGKPLTKGESVGNVVMLVPDGGEAR